MSVIWFLACLVVVVVYFALRRDWVLRVRLHLLLEAHSDYLALPAFDAMVFRYWYVWDVRWFISGKWMSR